MSCHDYKQRIIHSIPFWTNTMITVTAVMKIAMQQQTTGALIIIT